MILYPFRSYVYEKWILVLVVDVMLQDADTPEPAVGLQLSRRSVWMLSLLESGLVNHISSAQSHEQEHI